MMVIKSIPYFIVLFTSFLFAQSSLIDPKVIKQEDYKLWSYLQSANLSSDGKWLSWKNIYPNESDTLFIKNTNNNNLYYYEDISKIEYNEKHQLYILLNPKENKINLFVPKSTFKTSFKGTKAKFIFNNDIIFIENLKEKKLLFYNLITKQQITLSNIKEVKISDSENIVVAIKSDNSLLLINCENQKIHTKMILGTNTQNRTNTTISDQNTKIAVFQENGFIYNTHKGYSILLINLEKTAENYNVKTVDSIYKLQQENYFIINKPNYTSTQFTNDDKHLLFTTYDKNYIVNDNSAVEVWESNDTLEFSRKQIVNPKNVPILCSYNIRSKKIVSYNTTQRTQTIILNKSQYALQYIAYQYDSKYNRLGSSDIFLIDLNTNQRELIVKRHQINMMDHYIKLSPDNKSILYYDNNTWNIFNIIQKSHTTIKLDSSNDSFNQPNIYKPDILYPIDLGYWTTENTVLLNSINNYWIYNPKNKKLDKLINKKTNGFHLALQYTSLEYKKNTSNIYMTNQPAININKPLYFIGKDFKFNHNIYVYQNKKLRKKISSTHKLFDIKPSNNNSFIYTEQDSDLSPIINLYRNNSYTPIVKTNTHQFKYLYPKKEIINYTNSQGDTLKGVLFYPTKFDKYKKYPMITYIYEQQLNHEYQDFKIPSLFEGTGFNLINYTSNGFFVLYPDIVYQIGNPGKSALDCTVSAVNKTLNYPFVDISNLGLIGHSFGGYQANFIVTQTNLFKAVVFGAANSNLIHAALTLDKNNSYTSQTWRFLNYQMRMGISPQEDFLAYLNNSPIYHVNNVKVKTLSWTGEKDNSVDYSQSIAFHLAMRNLNKNNTLLIYPNEGHILLKPKNQIDLTNRIYNFFESNLKKNSVGD